MEAGADLVVPHAVVEDEVHVDDELGWVNVCVPYAFLLDHWEGDGSANYGDVVVEGVAEGLPGDLGQERAGVDVVVEEVEDVPAFLFPELLEGEVIEIVDLLPDLDVVAGELLFLLVLLQLLVLLPIVVGRAMVRLVLHLLAVVPRVGL